MNYRPYLLARIKAFHKEHNFGKGLNEVLDYDYMGSAEFEFGAIGKSTLRCREAIESKRPFSLVRLSVVPRKPFMQGDVLHALLPTENLELFGPSLSEGIQSVLDGKTRMKECMGEDLDFAAWHDIKNDVYFSPNPVLLNLIYSMLSRPIDYSATVGNTLSMGDVVKLAVLPPGHVKNTTVGMYVKEGKVSGLGERILTIKDYKPFRMPYVYILNATLNVEEAP